MVVGWWASVAKMWQMASRATDSILNRTGVPNLVTSFELSTPSPLPLLSYSFPSRSLSLSLFLSLSLYCSSPAPSPSPARSRSPPPSVSSSDLAQGENPQGGTLRDGLPVCIAIVTFAIVATHATFFHETLCFPRSFNGLSVGTVCVHHPPLRLIRSKQGMNMAQLLISINFRFKFGGTVLLGPDPTFFAFVSSGCNRVLLWHSILGALCSWTWILPSLPLSCRVAAGYHYGLAPRLHQRLGQVMPLASPPPSQYLGRTSMGLHTVPIVPIDPGSSTVLSAGAPIQHHRGTTSVVPHCHGATSAAAHHFGARAATIHHHGAWSMAMRYCGAQTTAMHRQGARFAA